MSVLNIVHFGLRVVVSVLLVVGSGLALAPIF